MKTGLHEIWTPAASWRLAQLEGQRAFGLAEFSWVEVSLADRDLFFRD